MVYKLRLNPQDDFSTTLTEVTHLLGPFHIGRPQADHENANYRHQRNSANSEYQPLQHVMTGVNNFRNLLLVRGGDCRDTWWGSSTRRVAAIISLLN